MSAHTRSVRVLPSALLAALLALGAVLATTLATAPGAAAAPRTSATTIRGGDVLYGTGGARCTIAFNAHQGSTDVGLVPGHCVEASSAWYADPGLTIPVGTSAGGGFPTPGYGLIRYTNASLSYPSEILAGGSVQQITGADDPRVGQVVCSAGRTTGVHCGTVTGVNATISFPEGILYGVFTADLCAEPGAPAGSAYSGSTALGIPVGGSGDCSSGGTSFFLPVTEALSAYGLSIG